MADNDLLKRITIRSEVFGGKPIIREMRIYVQLILGLLAQGETTETILEDYLDLELDDIRACIAYAYAAQHTSDAGRWQGREVPP
jgi:uncharacterized protein (DUF433 family)